MIVLTSTNDFICDDHGQWECDACVITEIELSLDKDSGTIIDLRGYEPQVHVDEAEVIEVVFGRPDRQVAPLPVAA